MSIDRAKNPADIDTGKKLSVTSGPTNGRARSGPLIKKTRTVHHDLRWRILRASEAGRRTSTPASLRWSRRLSTPVNKWVRIERMSAPASFDAGHQ